MRKKDKCEDSTTEKVRKYQERECEKLRDWIKENFTQEEIDQLLRDFGVI